VVAVNARVAVLLIAFAILIVAASLLAGVAALPVILIIGIAVAGGFVFSRALRSRRIRPR